MSSDDAVAPARDGGRGHGANGVQIVVTPGSGEGRALARAKWVRRVLVRHGVPAEIRAFDDLAALGEWARTCTPDFGCLVCVGGDATLSAAATAAIRGDVPFVPVPGGFGNVFAQVFGLSGRADAVLDLLRHGEVRRVDVGVVDGGELFLSHRSYGLLEQVQQAAEDQRAQPRERRRRHLAYYRAAGRLLLRAPLTARRVEVDGAVVCGDAVLVTVANVETYRGFLSLTPAASPIDGRFDVFVVPRVSRAGLAWRLLRLMLRLPGRWRGVQLYRGRRVAVTTPRRREELRTARRALPLLVPRGAIEWLQRRTVDEEAPAPVVP
jgi:diacylglycerol kinase (ATP)